MNDKVNEEIFSISHLKHDFLCDRLKKDIIKLTYCDNIYEFILLKDFIFDDIFKLVDVHRIRIEYNERDNLPFYD